MISCGPRLQIRFTIGSGSGPQHIVVFMVVHEKCILSKHWLLGLVQVKEKLKELSKNMIFFLKEMVKNDFLSIKEMLEKCSKGNHL